MFELDYPPRPSTDMAWADAKRKRDDDMVTPGETLTWEQCMNSKEDLTPKSWEWGEVPFPEIAYPGRTKFV